MQSTSPPSISFFYEIPLTLTERTRLKSFIQGIFKKEKRKLGSLNYIFCTDKRVLEINRQFLEHDYYTDIITFELSPPGFPVEAEIYISVDRVKDNARQIGTPYYMELHRVIFHGVLHLCGYKDKIPAQEKLMREKEDYYLGLYFK
jgi:probable rRNA maturation factor